jgi:hypothetical protein
VNNKFDISKWGLVLAAIITAIGGYATGIVTHPTPQLPVYGAAGATSKSPQVSGKHFSFGRDGGPILAPDIVLAPNGSIQGYTDENETIWGFDPNDPGTVVFYNYQGKSSTRFTSIQQSNELYVLKGTFLFQDNITHVLTQLYP